MKATISLQNYRCFGDSRPTQFAVGPGFTAFVGLNNAGKSALLRFFYEFRQAFQMCAPDQGGYPTLLGGGTTLNAVQGVLDQEELFHNGNDENIQFSVALDPGDVESEVEGIPTARTIRFEFDRRTRNLHAAITLSNNVTLAAVEGYVTSGAVIRHGKGPGQSVNIGALSSVLGTFANTMYVPAFRNAVNAGGGGKLFDLAIGQHVAQEWESRRGGPNKAANRSTSEVLRQIQRIFRFDHLSIDKMPGDGSLQIYANGHPFRLDEVGSGIAQFLILLMNVCFRKPDYLLIDEPELNLHPALQLEFLTTLASYARCGVLYATHSLGLARALSEQLFTVTRTDQGFSSLQPYEDTPDLGELLGSLGYGSYQHLGYDTVLLVEGPTDVPVFRQWLGLYGLEQSVVILPLFGKTLITTKRESELRELCRLAPRVFAVIDSERASEQDQISSDRLAFLSLCKEVGITAHALERRATENYFAQAAVVVCKGESFRALGPYEGLKAVYPRWDKGENWNIARSMTRRDIEDTDLGTFIRLMQRTAPGGNALTERG